ncbi:helix-turn-helix transcriptional regulator [Leucobacter chinensis]|uniref:helix-turn-helix transcriptional regulator n=1 Tax=Leucobacter chinensis TaxID=2851010 RepID=UPI001C22794E|nr:helix-turn-helix transcriptional regulator [Leucobacter chinensis]
MNSRKLQQNFIREPSYGTSLEPRSLTAMSRTTFHGRGLEELQISRAAMEFLATTNLVFEQLTDSKLVSVRSVSFPQVRFVHVHLPESRVLWPRTVESQHTATLIFSRAGRFKILSEAKFFTRSPGVALIPPGKTAIRFETTEPINEAIYLSIREPLFADILSAQQANSPATALNVQSLQPLLTFVMSACGITNVDNPVAEPLQTAAYEVTRSLLMATFGDQEGEQPSLFTRAHSYIMKHYSEKTLTIQQVAAHTDTSVRNLQQTFQKEGTSFTELLHTVRSTAALQLKEEFPTLKLIQIAEKCGFGSLSSLHRAFRSARSHRV